MPRDGSQVYHIPLGTEGAPDTTIESAKYNTLAHDLEQDLNAPRPIVAGGTGSSNPAGALAALSAETAEQLVDNYSSFAFVPGSFYSGAGATNEPIDGHDFAGVVYMNAAGDMVLEARDLTDVNHITYLRVKRTGVWSPWVVDGSAEFVFRAGDTMTGPLLMATDPTAPLQAATKQYIDARIAVIPSAGPPAGAVPGTMWWETDTGLLYIRYDDGDSVQWVIACPQPDVSMFMYMAAPFSAGTSAVATPDLSASFDVKWILNNANCTLNDPTGLKAGQRGTFYISQDTIGNRVITTWGSKYKFPGSIKPTLSTAANATDTISYTSDGVNLFCTFSKGLA
jgi:hypothetical protein